MQLKNQVEWALHCCAVLVGVRADGYLSTKALAEFHGVPKEYLSKALQALSQAGIVESTLGPSGGYRLARQPGEISFLDVVEAVEGRGPAFVCTEIRRNSPCRPEGMCDDRPCGIARIMWDAERAWKDRLRAVTLADLAAIMERDLPAALQTATDAWVVARS